MSALPASIVPLGDPRLRQASAAVTDCRAPAMRDARERLHAVLDAFRATHGFGRAVAAPQIGDHRRYIALNLHGRAFTVHNPRIVRRSAARFTLWDDCMSFPDLLVRVERHASIDVEYTDERGATHNWTGLDAADAELLQHEIDHLDGILALDRALDRASLVTRAAYRADPAHFDRQVDRPPQPLAPG